MSSTSAGAQYLARIEAERELRQGMRRAVTWATAGGVVAGVGSLLPMPWAFLLVLVGAASGVALGVAVTRWHSADPELSPRVALRVEFACYLAVAVVFVTTWALASVALELGLGLGG